MSFLCIIKFDFEKTKFLINRFYLNIELKEFEQLSKLQ